MQEFCPECSLHEIKSKIKAFQINNEEAMFMCPSPRCKWPFGFQKLMIFSRKFGKNPLKSWNDIATDYLKKEQELSDTLNLNTPPFSPGTEIIFKDSTIHNETDSLAEIENSNINNGFEDCNDIQVVDNNNYKANLCHNNKTKNIKIKSESIISFKDSKNIPKLKNQGFKNRALGKSILYNDKKNGNFLQINPYNLISKLNSDNNSQTIKTENINLLDSIDSSNQNNLNIINNKKKVGEVSQKFNFNNINNSSVNIVKENHLPSVKTENNVSSGIFINSKLKNTGKKFDVIKNEKSNQFPVKVGNFKKKKTNFERFDFNILKSVKVDLSENSNFVKVVTDPKSNNEATNCKNKIIPSNIKLLAIKPDAPLKQLQNENKDKNFEVTTPSNSIQNVPVTKSLDSNIKLSSVNNNLEDSSKEDSSSKDDEFELICNDIDFLSDDIKEEVVDESTKSINESLIRNRIRNKSGLVKNPLAFDNNKLESSNLNNLQNQDNTNSFITNEPSSTNKQLFSNEELLHCLEDNDCETSRPEIIDFNNLNESDDNLWNKNLENNNTNTLVNIDENNVVKSENPSKDEIVTTLFENYWTDTTNNQYEDSDWLDKLCEINN